MARIETYPIDTVLSDSDLLFGTNADDANATVNFTVGDLKTYILQGMANGTVTSVSGVGTVSGLTLTGTVTTSGDLTLGGTLALTSSDITTGLGYTPPTTNTTYDYGAVGAAGNISMAMTGSDATNDVVVMQAGTNITLTDNGGNIFTIDAAGGSGGVASFTNANGTFVSASVANTTATGTVTMGTIDLSATGTPSASTFLRGDNTWAVGGTGTVTSVAATHGGDAFVATVNNDPAVNPSVDITMSGNNTQYINGAGDLIALSTLPGAGAGTVSSVDVSGGTTGLTTSGGPITTSGVITLAGTLAAASGGTGKTSYTVADLLYADTTSSLAKLGIGTTGQVLSVTAGGLPSWETISGTGSVTSVALTAPSAFTVTGSPITSSGTLVLAANGTGAQYIDGAGALQTFPSIPQGIVTSLTTNNTSGAATLNAGTGVLNIPIYSAGGSYDWSLFADTGDIDPIASGDQVTIAGGTNVTTAIVGNTLTIDATQAVASLTTNNTSGAATLSGGILNVPIYATPAAGAAGDVQFNDGSNGFAAEGEFNYNTATNTLKVQGVTNQPSLKLASAQQQTPGLNSLLSEIESYYLTSEVGKIKFLGDGAFGIGTSNPTRLELQTTSAGAVVATTKATIKATGELILNQYGSGTFNSTAVKSLGVTASGNVVERDVSGGNINEMATQSLDVNSASAIGMQSSNVKLVLTNSDGTGATKTVQISGSTATLGTTTNGIMTIKVQSSQVAGGLGQTQITYASPSGSVNIGPAASSAAWILTFAYYGEADMVLIDATAI